MANELSELEATLFGGGPAKTGVAPKSAPTSGEAELFGGGLKPQQTQPQAQPVQDNRTTLGKVREAFQASNPLPMITMGLSDYIPAAIRRGVSASGFGRPQDEGKSLFELKKQEQAEREAIEARNPVSSTIGKTAGLVGGMALTPNVAVPRAIAALPYVGKLASPFATGATYSGIETLGETGDLGEAGKSALIGGGMGAAISPTIDRIIGKIATRPPRSGPPMNAEEAAYETLQKAGITKPSQGVVTGDPKQLAREKSFGADIYGDMQSQATQAAEKLVGGAQPLPAQAAQDAVEAIRAKALAEEAASKKAFDVARAEKGVFDRDVIENVGSKIMYDFSINPDMTQIASNKLAQQAAKHLDEALGQKIPISNQMSIVHSSMKHVEEARQLLNTYFREAKDGKDRFAIRSMIDNFDNQIENAINKGAFSGSPDALKKWQDARKLWSEYQERYGVKKTGSDAGSLVKTILDEKADPVKVAEMMFNAGMSADATMKKQAISVFDQMKRALGQKGQKINDIPELVNIKKAYLNTLMTPSGSTPADFARTAKQIDGFLNGPTRGLALTMLEGKERQALQNLKEAMTLMSRGTSASPATTNSKLGLAIELGGPILGGVAFNMMNAHPMLSTFLPAVTGVLGAGSTYKKSGFRQGRLANVPYQPSGPAFSGSYTVLPRLMAGEEEEKPPAQNAGGRIGRATGGKVFSGARQEAMRLVALAESMKKRHSETTKPLLEVDDNTIAKALAVANKGI